MPICPKCHKEINGLRNIVSGNFRYDMWVDGSDKIRYDEVDFMSDDNVNEWWCPECGEVLFISENEAEKFLKEKDELAELIIKKIKKNKTKKRKQWILLN